jgi:hypothetical protein
MKDVKSSTSPIFILFHSRTPVYQLSTRNRIKMTTQEEAKELVTKVLILRSELGRQKTNKKQAWNAMWLLDLSTLDEFYAEDVEISGFNPPKQTTWKGIEALRAVRNPDTTHVVRIQLKFRPANELSGQSTAKNSSP